MSLLKACSLIRCHLSLNKLNIAGSQILLEKFQRKPSLTFIQTKCYSEKALSRDTSDPRSDVSNDVRPLGEKVKEGAKTLSYTGVIVIGVGITGILFYYVFRELFSSKSSNSIYSAAFNKCIMDPDVISALGTPIKAYGEGSRRRRNKVTHAYYERDGANCIRMEFYLKGVRGQATVQLDMKEVNGKFEYRYLLVQLNDFTQKTFVLEDNRAALDNTATTLTPLQTFSNILLNN